MGYADQSEMSGSRDYSYHGHRICSEERGCKGKAQLGRKYKSYVDRLAIKHDKQYGVYECPHCGGYHLTTKLHKRDQYAPLVYTTGRD